MSRKDSPGVYIPPPLIYEAFFFAAVLMQKFFPLPGMWLHTTLVKVLGWLIITGSVAVLLFPALHKFIQSRNSVMTIRPAASLQTKGIYSITRNPMYLGLVILYIGIGFLKGNSWRFLILPFLMLTVQNYIIKREERYLQRAFGEQYSAYIKQVRRWV